MPTGGGPAVQVTREVGFFVHEAWDARTVYYSQAAGRELWRVPVSGGEEAPVLRIPTPGYLSGWDLTTAGIYYGTSRELELAGEEYTVAFFDFATGRTETLLRKEGPFRHWSLTVSPDEKWILYSEQPLAQSELMLIENFR